jgi:hypothetical protein
VSFLCSESCVRRGCPTQRAPDPERPSGQAGGSLRVFRHSAWVEIGSGKVAFSRLAYQRVTHTAGRYVRLLFPDDRAGYLSGRGSGQRTRAEIARGIVNRLYRQWSWNIGCRKGRFDTTSDSLFILI